MSESAFVLFANMADFVLCESRMNIRPSLRPRAMSRPSFSMKQLPWSNRTCMPCLTIWPTKCFLDSPMLPSASRLLECSRACGHGHMSPNNTLRDSPLAPTVANGGHHYGRTSNILEFKNLCVSVLPRYTEMERERGTNQICIFQWQQ